MLFSSQLQLITIYCTALERQEVKEIIELDRQIPAYMYITATKTAYYAFILPHPLSGTGTTSLM